MTQYDIRLKTDKERTKEIYMITCIEKWPRRPFLPVKRYKQGVSIPEVGTIHYDSLNTVHLIGFYYIEEYDDWINSEEIKYK